jgi:hypothetical protein
MKTTNFTKQIDSICDINLEHTENAPKIDNDRIHSLAINKINEEGGFVRRNTLAWQFMPMATAMVVILGMSVIGLNLLKPENVVMEYGELQDTSSTAVSSSSNSSNTSPMVGSEGFIPKGGLIAEHDGWIYFNDKHSFKQSGFMDNGALKNTINLAKSRPDGSEKQILDGNIYDVGNIIVPGDGWVYYNRLGSENQWIGTENKHEKENGIFRIREDGTALSKISTSSVRSSFVIENDRIFFTVESYLLQMNDEVFDTTSGNLYSMKTDGTDVKILVEYDVPTQNAQYIAVFESWKEQYGCECIHRETVVLGVVYNCGQDCTGFSNQDFDWSIFPKIDGAQNVLYYNDGWLYYTGGDMADSLRRVRLDGSESQNTRAGMFNPFAFFEPMGLWYNSSNSGGLHLATWVEVEEQIYYVLTDGSVWKIGIDGENKVQIAQLPQEAVDTHSDLLHPPNTARSMIQVHGERVYVSFAFTLWSFEENVGDIVIPMLIK